MSGFTRDYEQKQDLKNLILCAVLNLLSDEEWSEAFKRIQEKYKEE